MGLVSNLNDLRYFTKGRYDTDLHNINEGQSFPSPEVRARHAIYESNMRLFNGDYSRGKRLLVRIDGAPKEVDYKILPLNFFKLIINKLDSMLFSNEWIIHTGDIERDRIVNSLIERTSWIDGIRKAVRLCEIYGDCIIKTYRNGISACAPYHGYKVVDSTNINKTKWYVLREYLFDNKFNPMFDEAEMPSHIRILISAPGFDYERVFEYNGNIYNGTIGKPVRYKYNDRWIPKSGRYYNSGVDIHTVQWMSVNTEDDGLYGTSAFDSIKHLVFALENRMSMDNFILDAHGLPLLIIGMTMALPDEQTGGYKLRTINDKFLIDHSAGGENKPQYLTWDGHLDNSKQVRDDLLGYFYELSEMGRTYLSGEYQGNPSEETISNIIKSAIDRGTREINTLYPEIKKSLYVLCHLNDIDVNIEDINIEFNIGRADDIKVLSEVCDTLSASGLFSKETLLCKFWGYNIEDAKAEIDLVKKEKEAVENDSSGMAGEVVRLE